MAPGGKLLGWSAGLLALMAASGCGGDEHNSPAPTACLNACDVSRSDTKGATASGAGVSAQTMDPARTAAVAGSNGSGATSTPPPLAGAGAMTQMQAGAGAGAGANPSAGSGATTAGSSAAMASNEVVTCKVGDEEARWDPATRTLTIGPQYWVASDSGHVSETGTRDPDAATAFNYDDHDNASGRDMKMNGMVTATLPITNDYDPSGHLAGITAPTVTSVLATSYIHFDYEGDRVSAATVRKVVTQGAGIMSGIGAVTIEHFHYDGARVDSLLLENPNYATMSPEEVEYDAAGRLTKITRTDPPQTGSGPPVVSEEIWTYSDAGECIRYQGGTFTLELDPACAAIPVFPHILYLYPRWYDPDGRGFCFNCYTSGE